MKTSRDGRPSARPIAWRLSLAMLCALGGGLPAAESTSDPTADQSCGLASLRNLALLFGRTPSAPLDDTSPAEPQGFSLATLMHLAGAAGLRVVPVRVALTELGRSGLPAIIHLREPDHFVAVLGGFETHLRLLEGWPGRLVTVPIGELATRYSGHALVGHYVEAAGPLAAPLSWHHELGEINPDSKLTQAFTIANRGTAPLTLSLVSKSCGCATVELPPDAIEPNEQGVVTVGFGTGSYGIHRHEIVLASNDPNRPRLNLTIAGVVTPGATTALPPAVALRQSHGASATGQVELLGNASLVITSVTCEPEIAEAAVTAVSRAQNRSVVALRVLSDAQLPPGEHKARLRVQIKGGEREELDVPLTVTVQHPVRAQPESVFLGKLDAQSTTKVAIVLTAAPGVDFRVTDVVSGTDAVRVLTVTRKDAAWEVQIEVRLLDSRPVVASLEVSTDLSTVPLVIPVAARR